MKLIKIRKKSLIPKIKDYFNNDLNGKKVAIWGLAFKPNTDDIREAPSIDIINELLLEEVSISAYDPEAMPNMNRIYGDKVQFKSDAYSTLIEADCLIICTEWSEFISPSFDKMKDLMKNPAVFDGRNIFDLEVMDMHGFHYESVGRKVITK